MINEKCKVFVRLLVVEAHVLALFLFVFAKRVFSSTPFFEVSEVSHYFVAHDCCCCLCAVKAKTWRP